MQIDVASLDPAAVLWTLYNDAMQSPLSLSTMSSAPLGADEALSAYNAESNHGDVRHFGAVNDRPLGITFHDFVGEMPRYVDVTRYNEHYGTKAAQNAITALRMQSMLQFQIELARERLERAQHQELDKLINT
jgi:hypothetical protein